MKHLRIENRQGQYLIEEGDWKFIDKLNKEDLLKLAYFALEEGFEMDEYSEEAIKNPAHQIIYKNIYDKLLHLTENKDRFKDESAQKYKNAFDKYSSQNKPEVDG